jgi:imidazolonepropionase-like amidohydrolase
MGPASRTAVPAGATRVDGRGKFLMPGLADMYTHFAQGDGSPASPAGRQLTELLANGVTTVRGLVAPPGYLAVRERAAKGKILAPTIFVAGPSLNGNSVKTVDDAKRMVHEQKAAGYDLLKTHGGLSRELYDTVVAAAKREGIRLVGRVTAGYGLARAMEAGQQVEHLDGYIAAVMKDGASAPDGQMIVDEQVLSQVDESKIKAIADATRRAGVWNGLTLALFRTVASPTPPESLAARPEMRYVPKSALDA